MSDQNQASLLANHWIHSHEEDTAGLKVFRPASFPFPPSRGRHEYNLQRDGTMATVGPGPTDKRVSGTGTWTVEGQNILTMKLPGMQQAMRHRIVSLDSDRLVLEEVSPTDSS